MRTHPNRARNIVIVGESPVVCHAIAHLVQSGGYTARIVDMAQDDTALTDADAVLIAGANAGRQGTSWLAESIPVLRLVDTLEEKKALRERGILWPCTSRELQDSIAVALDTAALGGPL